MQDYFKSGYDRGHMYVQDVLSQIFLFDYGHNAGYPQLMRKPLKYVSSPSYTPFFDCSQ